MGARTACLYLSQHPLQIYETLLAEQTVPISSLVAAMEGKSVTVGGAISESREIVTKNGQKMAFVKLEDLSGELEVILFPSVYQQTMGIWERDQVVIVRGKINTKDREGNLTSEVKVMADDAREVTVEQAQAYQTTGRKLKAPKAKTAVAMKGPGAKAAAEAAPEKVYVRVENSQNEKLLLDLKKTIDDNQGRHGGNFSHGGR